MFKFFKKKEVIPETQEKKSWLSRLTGGLSKTTAKISSSLVSLFTNRKIDDQLCEELEDVLIAADFGVKTSAEFVASLRKEKFNKEATPEEISQKLIELITIKLTPFARSFAITSKPHIILVCGVNGNGKTTTIGKLAKKFQDEGKKVLFAAADTFRAAAVEQLQVWADRVGTDCVTGAVNADPASVAFQAVEKAKSEGYDVVLIDTAGRLHNKTNLMEELQKIKRVINKQDEAAPHEIVLVLDATTGQNALSQVETFNQIIGLTGLIVTKLDGTAKGGVVVALADKFNLPIYAIGVGEQVEDLGDFSAEEFARALFRV
jgi:fused signal recognition particle receptor